MDNEIKIVPLENCKSYSFDYVVCSNKISIIRENCIYFQRGVIALLGNPKEVNIGIDEQNKAMLIIPADTRLRTKKYVVKSKHIYCREVIAKIRQITKSKIFEVTFDRDLGGLLVKLGD